MFTVNKNPTVSDLRSFGYAMFIGFGVIGAILFFAPWIRTGDVLALGWTGTRLQIAAVSLGGLGAALCLLSLLWPSVAKPVYVVWMTGATAMGMVMSTIILTLLFFLLLPVFSIIVRAGDPLRKKLKPNGTYWEDHKPHEPTIERMKRQF